MPTTYPVAVVPRHWTMRQMEAAIDAISDLRSTSRLDGPDTFGERTMLAVAYEAMVGDGAERRFKLEPLTNVELDQLAGEYGLGHIERDALLGFARAVERRHGIEEEEIPF